MSGVQKQAEVATIPGADSLQGCDQLFSLPALYCGYNLVRDNLPHFSAGDDGGAVVKVYLDLAVLLNFLVDFLLLLGANRLAGYPAGLWRCIGAAAVGGIYGGACLLPGFSFLGNTAWRLISLGAMGGIAFGWNRSAIPRVVLFVLLSMALGGIALGLNSGGFIGLLTGAVLTAALCVVGFRGGAMARELVEVELCRAGVEVKLTALRDTGNTLCDPVTGQSVLVVDAQSAWELLGLTQKQLKNPVETVSSGVIPGLRLIPFRSVGCDGGMLVALRIDRVRIGSWYGSSLVAFAPEGLGGNGTYRALTGGVVS